MSAAMGTYQSLARNVKNQIAGAARTGTGFGNTHDYLPEYRKGKQTKTAGCGFHIACPAVEIIGSFGIRGRQSSRKINSP